MHIRLNPRGTDRSAGDTANTLTRLVASRNGLAATKFYNNVNSAVDAGEFDNVSDQSFEDLLDALDFAEAVLDEHQGGLGDRQSRRERRAARKRHRARRRDIRKRRKAGEISRSDARALRKESRGQKKEDYKEIKSRRKERRDRRKSGISSTIGELGPDEFEDGTAYLGASGTPIYMNPIVIGGVVLLIGGGIVLVTMLGKD